MWVMEMARYKKIHVTMYADDKFNSLSKPQPNGQTLWVYLLTGPHTNVIPGISTIGEAALAEALEWSLEDFREVFHEVYAKGMAKADWKRRLLWIPNAVKFNPPESPNVIKGWGKAWPELPECELKVIAINSLRKYMEDLPKGFQVVFHEVFRQPSPNQEQEQEQEQKKNGASAPAGDAGIVPELFQDRPEKKNASTGKVHNARQVAPVEAREAIITLDDSNHQQNEIASQNSSHGESTKKKANTPQARAMIEIWQPRWSAAHGGADYSPGKLDFVKLAEILNRLGVKKDEAHAFERFGKIADTALREAEEFGWQGHRLAVLEKNLPQLISETARIENSSNGRAPSMKTVIRGEV
jgi:hypothetical protein